MAVPAPADGSAVADPASYHDLSKLNPSRRARWFSRFPRRPRIRKSRLPRTRGKPAGRVSALSSAADEPVAHSPYEYRSPRLRTRSRSASRSSGFVKRIWLNSGSDLRAAYAGKTSGPAGRDRAKSGGRARSTGPASDWSKILDRARASTWCSHGPAA